MIRFSEGSLQQLAGDLADAEIDKQDEARPINDDVSACNSCSFYEKRFVHAIVESVSDEVGEA